MASYEEVVKKDLELLWSIQEYCYRTPWLNNMMSRIVSKYPHKDIVIIVWIFFGIGLIEIGTKHFWVAVTNIIVAFTARRLIESKRPVEYDVRLQPLTDKGAESYAFPSLESYMSVVIMGHLFLSFKSLLLLPLGLAVIVVVGFSRVYSRSRFPHQIVGSWLCGFVGLLASMHCCHRISFHTMKDFDHTVCVAVVMLGIVANVALNIENNDSRLVHIPKQEFIRVLADIVSGGSRPDDPNAVISSSILDSNEDDEDKDMFIAVNGSVGDGRQSMSSSAGTMILSPYDVSGAVGTGSGGRGGSGGSRRDSSGRVSGETPRTTALKLAQSAAGASAAESGAVTSAGSMLTQRRIKSDSLFFLQRSMEAREDRFRKESYYLQQQQQQQQQQLHQENQYQ